MVLKTIMMLFSLFLIAFIGPRTIADKKLFDFSDFQSDKGVSYKEEEEKASKSQSNSTQLVENEYKTNSSNVNKTLISCIRNKAYFSSTVEIVNATRLSQVLQLEPNVTQPGMPGTCVAVLFYSPSCPFSCLAAPHYNALPKYFPDIKMIAVDVNKCTAHNVQYGVIGTPTLMLFHSGRPAVRFNETDKYELEVFAEFITTHTGIEPTRMLMLTSSDYGGPLSHIPVKETDYYLILSWIVIVARLLYSFYKSTWGRSFVDATLNAWREAEAQHHHAD